MSFFLRAKRRIELRKNGTRLNTRFLFELARLPPKKVSAAPVSAPDSSNRARLVAILGFFKRLICEKIISIKVF